MGKFKNGTLTQQEAESFVKEASADDPIYTRGFAIGVKRLPGKVAATEKHDIRPEARDGKEK